MMMIANRTDDIDYKYYQKPNCSDSYFALHVEEVIVCCVWKLIYT